MPCGALARGIRQAPPHASPMAFNDAINNSPCGKPALLTVAGVSVAGENLCMFHWIQSHGYLDYRAPITKET